MSGTGVRQALTVGMCLTAAGVLLLSGAPAQGIREGLTVCYEVIIPSLFPFMVLCSFMNECGITARVSQALSPLSRLLFGGCEAGAGVWLTSAVGGYPVGAKTVSELYSAGKISLTNARRMLCFCVNSGPAFAVTAVGAAFCGSRTAGFIILASVTAASLVCGMIFCRLLPEKPVLKQTEPKTAFSVMPFYYKKASLPENFVKAVSSSAAAILTVCGFAVIFSCITSALSKSEVSGFYSAAFSAVLEVSKGCGELGNMGASPALMAAAVGFGGLCVHFQVLSISKDISPPITLFFLSRLFHGFLSFVFARILTVIFPQALTVSASGNLPRSLGLSSSPLASVSLVITCVLLILDTGRTQSVKKSDIFNKIF